MSRLHSQSDECLILVKALPHRSSSYFETVCCAGIGRDLKWRRLYPVPFRVLSDSQQFGRWNWLKYHFTLPENDGRRESQKVVPESIEVVGKLRQSDRSRIADALTRSSVAEAEDRGDSLTLLKPSRVKLSWRRKDESELSIEREKHAALANQLSMLDQPTKPLEPCPFAFSFDWANQDGKAHSHTCDDWETSTAFFVRRKTLGEEGALKSLRTTFEEEYLSRGMRFALGTHSRRKKQWLLVGVLRVDDQPQGDLFT